jgi:hypothetical protein
VLIWTSLSGCNIFYGAGKEDGWSGVNSVVDKAAKTTGKSIVADCVVTAYGAGKATYLSEQRHIVYPQSQGLDISGSEPGGRFEWKLLGGDFRVVEGKPKAAELSGVMYDRNIAKLLLTSIVAGSGMSAQLSESSESVKVQGRWYSVIRIGLGTTLKGLKSFEVPWAKITLYGDSGRDVIDRVVIEDVASGERLMAHSYNFWRLKEIDKSIPTKIDIFKIDANRTEQQPLLSIAYHIVKIQ